MTGNKKFIPVLSAGLIMTSLGVLWSLQGAAVIRIRPILCLSNCKPITEGSASWLGLVGQPVRPEIREVIVQRS